MSAEQPPVSIPYTLACDLLAVLDGAIQAALHSNQHARVEQLRDMGLALAEYAEPSAPQEELTRAEQFAEAAIRG